MKADLSVLAQQQVGALHGRIARSVEGVVRFFRISFLDFIPALISGSFALTAALSRAFFALPLVTFKIVAAIHWEALRLWLKGARLVPRQNAAAANAVDTVLAAGKRTDYTAAALPAAAKGKPGPRESALVQ